MKIRFEIAHKMAKRMKASYPSVDYRTQFGLCLAYVIEKEKKAKAEAEKRVSVNEMLDWTWEEIEKVDISTLHSYGIRYFSFGASATPYTEEREAKLHRLQERLQATDEEPKAEVGAVLVKANCGHSVTRNALMAASFGTSCGECYDRMSG